MRKQSTQKEGRKTFIDLTEELTVISEQPLNGGSFCDLYIGELRDGSRVALKTLRLHTGREEKVKKVRDLPSPISYSY